MSQTTISVTEKIFPKQMSLRMKKKCLQDFTCWFQKVILNSKKVTMKLSRHHHKDEKLNHILRLKLT
ncbi:unnamed protein product [Acanthoscelides obtectus]|uniref:Uncharacterized protein n=1 Tax=Acanthoscelides obtectus TaxID=200917 RepID=A0A9P0KRX6_ACAOB|nr:unnamed protein product [Acanthoscelides obtectus]CAK1674811.1 hypothetical protein AOBTE_LOCUS29750 [Acanthoscelides obtectus]